MKFNNIIFVILALIIVMSIIGIYLQKEKEEEKFKTDRNGTPVYCSPGTRAVNWVLRRHDC